MFCTSVVDNDMERGYFKTSKEAFLAYKLTSKNILVFYTIANLRELG